MMRAVSRSEEKMALTKCKECSHEVSKSAESCPNCGAPVKKKPKQYGCGTLVFIVIVGMILLGKFSSDETPITPQKDTYNTTKTVTPATRRNLRYAYSTINIREGAGKSHKVIGKLKRGDIVEVKNIENKWAKVSIGSIDKGYVYEPLLKHNPIPPLEISSWNWHTDSDFGTNGAVIWNVEVKNNTIRYIESVKVEFCTYDSSGNIITSDFTYVNGLSPGGTASSKSYATYYGPEKKGRIRIVK